MNPGSFRVQSEMWRDLSGCGQAAGQFSAKGQTMWGLHWPGVSLESYLHKPLLTS
jgi:hypothetical protein